MVAVSNFDNRNYTKKQNTVTKKFDRFGGTVTPNFDRFRNTITQHLNRFRNSVTQNLQRGFLAHLSVTNDAENAATVVGATVVGNAGTLAVESVGICLVGSV